MSCVMGQVVALRYDGNKRLGATTGKCAGLGAPVHPSGIWLLIDG